MSTHRHVVYACVLWATLALPAPLAAQSPATIWDGIYTPAQAERGRQIYERVCGYCHRSDLDGGENGAPSLKAGFLARWRKRSLSELVLLVMNTMPQGSPGTISAQDYLDVISFIFKKNLVPAGATELDRDSIRQVVITDLPGG